MMLCLRRMYFPAWALCVGVLLCFGSVSPVSAEAIMDGKALLALGRGSNLCALTFDDGPSRHTGPLLDLLRDRGIKATFFVVGSQIRYHPQLIQRMQEEGHEVANHTNSHVTLRHLSPEAQRGEIGNVQAALARLGVTSRFIRPPYGRYDATTVKVAKEQGVSIMLWSVDSMDWMRQVSIENMKTLVSGQKLRGVFLFHDTHAPTVEAMPNILDRLVADGCQFVTISEFMGLMGTEPSDPNTVLVEKQEKTPDTTPVLPGKETPTLPAMQGESDADTTPEMELAPELQNAVSPSPELTSPTNRSMPSIRPNIRPNIRPILSGSRSAKSASPVELATPTAFAPVTSEALERNDVPTETQSGGVPSGGISDGSPGVRQGAHTVRVLPATGRLPDPA